MTFDQIEREFPNGLHDAGLSAFSVDLVKQTLVLDVEVDLTDPERELAPDEPGSKRVRITVEGLRYFRIEPPDIRDRYELKTSRLSAGEVKDNPELMPRHVFEQLSNDCFVHWLFLSKWNSFLVLAGTDARYEDIATFCGSRVSE